VSKLQGVILDMESLAPSNLNTENLHSLDEVEWTIYDHTEAEDTVTRLRTADIVFTNKVIIDQDVLDQAPNLKYIGVFATGTNNIDIAACEARGIAVRNVEGYGTATVAQHAIMLMLMLATSANRYTSAVKQGQWSKSEQFCMLDFPVIELAGKQLLIVGYGELGQAVASIATAFGMQVSVAERSGEAPKGKSQFLLNGQVYARKPLEEALANADFVSLHCALNKHTESLVDTDFLEKMKSTGFLINTARGGLVDEAALLVALRNRHIAGAGLDVLRQEPPTQDNSLITADLDNLIITPHSAWAAKEARQRLLNSALRNLKLFLAEQ
jgi:glycerate dehydrogenase